MNRQIIKIDEDACNGCGLCVTACHEGAIGMIDGKAKLLRDDYCDGLGNCLPVCPTGAISFETREADAFDEEAVKNAQKKSGQPETKKAPMMAGCPGRAAHSIERMEATPLFTAEAVQNRSELLQWPVQIKLAPVNAPYFNNANLLVAADCTAFSYASFHRDFMRNHVTLIGCPKLDEGDYSEKLGEIIRRNNIKSVKVVRMEVPCCGGIEYAVRQALIQSGKMIPWQVVVISTDGKILSN
jgi:Fe-S-cluster-containing hydrogenase component 2